MMNHLIDKYDVPVPRYTSYPTVPYWDKEPPLHKQWHCLVKETYKRHPEISLYIHLPFCESLCTFCGCNKRITKNHKVEGPYVDALLKEWEMYVKLFDGPVTIKELHIGGGTPTFFHPNELSRLMDGIFSHAKVAEKQEYGFEVHPNSTEAAHLKVLRQFGFNRLSIGVQDFSPKILKLINRKQTAEDIERVNDLARVYGYESINYDLVFGLPQQTQQDIMHTIYRVKGLKPDRIAYYSYAHVPWIKPSQRAYTIKDLPAGKEKRDLYEIGRTLLEGIGYREIGLDHFALPHDSLYQALEAKDLHRNFMGYTSQFTQLSIGLGASAISDSWSAYVQNEKNVESYQELVNAGRLPFFKGHVLTTEDLNVRKHILNLMCRYETSWDKEEVKHPSFSDNLDRIKSLEADGLVEFEGNQLKVNHNGKPFIRNICQAFDARLWRNKPKDQIFSQAV